MALHKTNACAVFAQHGTEHALVNTTERNDVDDCDPPQALEVTIWTSNSHHSRSPRTRWNPHISQRTVGIHYHKHHQGYMDKLDKALANDKRRALTLEEIVRGSDGEVFNNAAQVWNHDFYWRSIEPGSNTAPAAGPLLRQIEADFGSMDTLQEQLRTVAAGPVRYGAGGG
jgi:superoxide dismutase